MKNLNRKGIMTAAAVLTVAFCCFFAARRTGREENSARLESAVSDQVAKERCVVIDAGHGGADPGKVGINGALEQDINLKIALLLKQYLEMEDVKVVMTRENGEGLYDPGTPNRKAQDMKRRVAIIDEVKPSVTVSIHQNSYPEEYVHGAQVFFFTGSREGQELAESVQASLVERVDSENRRGIKANGNYYLLKKTATPIVIVECGFLSNNREAELLCSDSYQEKMAWAIHLGVLQYLNLKK